MHVLWVGFGMLLRLLSRRVGFVSTTSIRQHCAMLHSMQLVFYAYV